MTALQLAVADREGSAELYYYLMMSASGSLHFDESLADLQRAQMSAQDVAPRGQTGFEMRRYQVRTVAIDDCLSELKVERVDLVERETARMLGAMGVVNLLFE